MTATISLGADFDQPTSAVWKAFADVDQVVSFVGQGMIDGHRNGHDICLRQLGEHFSG